MTAPPASEVREIPLTLIDTSRFNVRKDLQAGTEESSLDDLAESIRQKGLLNPITVRPIGDRFELIAGQRRFVACQRLGLPSVRAIVRFDTTDTDSLEISLIENVHRAEMHPLDKARALNDLLSTYQGDVGRVARETGISQQTVKRYLAISRLPAEIQAKLSTAEGPARVGALAVLAQTFTKPEEMIAAYDQISGFTQPVQLAILGASDGDVQRVPNLVEQAIAGAFNIRTCRGVGGMLVCEALQELPDGFQNAVVDVIRKQAMAPSANLEAEVRKLTRLR